MIVCSGFRHSVDTLCLIEKLPCCCRLLDEWTRALIVAQLWTLLDPKGLFTFVSSPRKLLSVLSLETSARVHFNVLFWSLNHETFLFACKKSPLSHVLCAKRLCDWKRENILWAKHEENLSHTKANIEISCFVLWKLKSMLLSAAPEENRKQLCLIRVPKSFISHRAVTKIK